MSTRPFAVIAAAALLAPALAPADLGPHSTWYAVHKHGSPQKSNVNVVVYRIKKQADVNATNKCLGTSKPPGGGTSYLNTFDAYPLPVKKGHIDFHGNGHVYSGSSSAKTHADIKVTLTATKATGTIKLAASTHCATIRFTAPLAMFVK